MKQLAFIFTLLLCGTLNAQEDGLIYGTITDGATKEPLAFASIGIRSLGVGTSTELDGTYRLPNLPAGTYLLEISYLGYGTSTETITLASNQELEFSYTLLPEGETLQEVVVSAQLQGQRAAINQQINSNTIVNVVSKERLQELPDQNAAESVGRLSGVSVFRDAGEGQRISVRGISPRLNSITINGQRLPSTQQNDRSTDLSMISPDMLEGIELYKALTPDRDGDAVGGAVNFTVAKAREGRRVVARGLGTYNDLGNSFNNYRANLSISDRFGTGNQFGYILTGNYQQIDRSNEFITTDYEFVGVDTAGDARLPISSLNLGTIDETRTRGGGSLIFDFSPTQEHTFMLSSTAGFTAREELRWRRRYRYANSEQRFDLRRRERDITLVSNSLSGKHKLGVLEIDWSGSYSFSRQNQPYTLNSTFQELNAVSGEPSDPSDLNEIPGVFRNDLGNMILREIEYETRDVDEDHITGQLDVKYNFRTSDNFSGYFKAGAKVRRITRGADVTVDFLRPYLPNENPALDNPERFIVGDGNEILLTNFLGAAIRPDFFGGDFSLQPGTDEAFVIGNEGFDLNEYNKLFGTNFQSVADIPVTGAADIDRLQAFYEAYRAEFQRDAEGDLEDYDGEETVSAAYLMTELKIGPKVTFLGGVRMENTQQDYASRIVAAREEGDEEVLPDPETIAAGQSYTDWLPMVHLKYQASEWFDVRGAVTKTLARPDFFSLVPWARINNSEQEIDRGKPDLLNTNAWNYDLFLSFYNRYGLLTLGGFYKELTNVDFIRTSVFRNSDSPFNGYNLTEPDNVPESTVRGVEIDVQANLGALDSRFWSGFVLSGNITFLQSETAYPLLIINRVSNPTPPPFFITEIIDTLRPGPLVGQANLIANLNLGYEKGGFSGRLSWTYQGEALSPGNPGIGSGNSGVGIRAEQDNYDDSFVRMDLALKQRLDKKGRWTVMCNVNNLLDTPEQSFLFGSTSRLQTAQEFFGRTIDVGFLWKFIE